MKSGEEMAELLPVEDNPEGFLQPGGLFYNPESFSPDFSYLSIHLGWDVASSGVLALLGVDRQSSSR